MRSFITVLALLIAGSLPVAIAQTPPRSAQVTPSSLPAPVLHVVPERYVTPSLPAEEMDSLATWTAADGALWVIATAKSTHRLLVFNGATGALLHEVGVKGTLPGQFNRPNGIAVAGNHLFVVERDNHRKIILGSGGEMIRDIRHSAQRELRKLLQRPVRLELHVVVEEAWRDRPDKLDRFQGSEG